MGEMQSSEQLFEPPNCRPLVFSELASRGQRAGRADMRARASVHQDLSLRKRPLKTRATACCIWVTVTSL